MTIEEKAKAFTDNISVNFKSAEAVEKMREIIEEIYIQSHRSALTSLLEELPEVDKTDYSAIIYQTAYREKIKSLIQNKLK